MLPGFRFLFAAVVLSVSTLVFGLGAAALLRASHEQFASLPQLMPAPALPGAVGAEPSQEAAPPTLAMLRIDNPVDEAAKNPVAEKAASATAPEPVPAPPPAATEPPPATLPVPAQHVLKEVAQEPSPATVVVAPEPVQPALTASPEVAAAVPAAPASDPANKGQAAVEPETAKTAEPLVAAVPDAPAIAMAAPPPLSAPAPALEPVVATAAPTPAIAAPSIAAPSNEPAITAAAPAPATETPLTSAAASEAPIRTAMLDQDGPAMETATPLAPVAIEGPIPLPRSRAWALTRSQPTKPAVKQRKLVSRTARPQAARAPVAPPAPARRPSGFLFE